MLPILADFCNFKISELFSSLYILEKIYWKYKDIPLLSLPCDTCIPETTSNI
jgi:hypothetical protein